MVDEAALPAPDRSGPPRCKWIMAVLGPSPRPPEALFRALERAFGPLDHRGEFLPFDVTGYYAPEFGPDLSRGWVSFRGLDGPERLPALKRKAAETEREWAVSGRRTWNLDVGYMDADKVVLASFKRGPCKLYLGDGVYADLLLKYSRGRFEPLPWAFADLRDGRYGRQLLTIREKLKAESRQAGRPERPA
jgi:hypothetical protein